MRRRATPPLLGLFLIAIGICVTVIVSLWLVVVVQGPKLDPVVPTQHCPQTMPQLEDYKTTSLFPSHPLETTRESFRKYSKKKLSSSSSSNQQSNLMGWFEKELQPFIQTFNIANELSVSCSAKFFAEINSTKYVVKVHPRYQAAEDDSTYLAITKRHLIEFAEKNSVNIPAASLPFRFGNEELCHALDLLIGFNRTPPAYFLPLHSSFISSSVQSTIQKEKLRHCQINYTEWKENISKIKNKDGAMVIFTAIQFVPEVKEIYLGKVLNFVQSLNPIYRGREMGTRVFFDFLVGNIDRLNVNHFSKKSKSGDQVLLYMDQNSLVYDELHGDEYLDYLSNLMSTICKFYAAPIEKLRALSKRKKLSSELVKITYFLNSHMAPFFEAYEMDFQKLLKRLPFTTGIQSRAEQALEIVDQCLATYGSDYVFCDE